MSFNIIKNKNKKMEKFPKPITKQCIKIIFSQMDEAIYKIKNKQRDKDIGIGIFCYINYKNKKTIVYI